ncbi:hypothetical protein AAP_05328 [Ascosphaera apis ARSEF 7405]|uniref:Myb/SANT-like domain-containing protein n=1 Tax=Ascosphaera apis ARSEF 7405 TaxID=392613 RepID=A0A167VQ25_9EURO|nr:hypothetical protein AAP_05328 [Ascosphaera apis ARSEF 7405]
MEFSELGARDISAEPWSDASEVEADSTQFSQAVSSFGPPFTPLFEGEEETQSIDVDTQPQETQSTGIGTQLLETPSQAPRKRGRPRRQEVRRRKRRVVWQDDMMEFTLMQIISLQSEGYMGGKLLTREGFDELKKRIYTTFQIDSSESQIRHKIRGLQAEYRLFKSFQKATSGWGTSEGGVLDNDPGVVDAFFDHPNHAQFVIFRDRRPAFEHLIAQLVDGLMATGKDAMTPTAAIKAMRNGQLSDDEMSQLPADSSATPGSASSRARPKKHSQKGLSEREELILSRLDESTNRILAHDSFKPIETSSSIIKTAWRLFKEHKEELVSDEWKENGKLTNSHFLRIMRLFRDEILAAHFIELMEDEDTYDLSMRQEFLREEYEQRWH